MDIIYYRIQVLNPTLGRWISCAPWYRPISNPGKMDIMCSMIQTYIQSWEDGYHVLHDTDLYPTLGRWISFTQDCSFVSNPWLMDIKYYRIQFYIYSMDIQRRHFKNMVGSTLNCIQCFRTLAVAQLKPVYGGFETRLKFIKFRLWT